MTKKRNMFQKRLRQTFPNLNEELSENEIDQSLNLAEEIYGFGDRLRSIFPDLDSDLPDGKLDRLFEIATQIQDEVGTDADVMNTLCRAKGKAAVSNVPTLEHSDLVLCILNHVFKTSQWANESAWEETLLTHITPMFTC